MRATGAELKAMAVSCGDRLVLWIRDGQKLHNYCGCSILAARKAEVVNRRYNILHGFADYNFPLHV